jgi:hypothetical protein
MGVRGKGKEKPFSKGFPSPSPGRRRPEAKQKGRSMERPFCFKQNTPFDA